MAAVTKTNNLTRISTTGISGFLNRLVEAVHHLVNRTDSLYSAEDYQRDLAEQEARKSIERAKHSVYSYGRL